MSAAYPTERSPWDVDWIEILLLCTAGRGIDRPPTDVELSLATARLIRVEDLSRTEAAFRLDVPERTVRRIVDAWDVAATRGRESALARGDGEVALRQYAGRGAWIYRPAPVDAASWRVTPLPADASWAEINVVVDRAHADGAGEHEIAWCCGIADADLSAVMTRRARECARPGCCRTFTPDRHRDPRYCTATCHYGASGARYAQSLPYCACGCGAAITEERRRNGAQTAPGHLAVVQGRRRREGANA